MTSRLLITLCFFVCSDFAIAQVDEIKQKSKDNSSKRGSSDQSSSGTGSGGFALFRIFDVLGFVGQAQQYTVSKKTEIPYVVSLDIMAQVAIQPSSYYVIHPRIRGNWGIFSTDFRTNHVIEEDIDGYKYLNTIDWQVLQLNFLNLKNVNFRVGAGYMKENFADRYSFFEWTMAMNIYLNNSNWRGTTEYRTATDFGTGAVPRREWSLNLQKRLFTAGRWNGFATGGVLFQRYYSAITVWGFQGGLVFSLM